MIFHVPDKKFCRKQDFKEKILKIKPSLANTPLLMMLSSSLSVETGQPEEGYVGLTADTLYVFTEDRERAAWPLSRLSSFQSTVGVGETALECRLDGRLCVICRGDLSHKAEYATAAKQINRWQETGYFDKDYDKTYQRYCPTCGRRLPPGSSICMHCVKKTRILKRMWEIAKPYRGPIFVSVLLFFVITALNLIDPLINRLIVDRYITPHFADYSFFLVILSLFFLSLLSRVISVFRGEVLIRTGNKIIVRLRDMVFSKVQTLSISRISRRTAGEIMQRVTQDTDVINEFIAYQLSDIIEQFLILCGITVLLFAEDWKLALMILLPIPVCSLLFQLFDQFLDRIYEKQWTTNEKANTILHDIFSGIRVVKAFGMEHHEMERYDTVTRQEAEISAKNERMYSILLPILFFMMSVGEFFLLYYVGSAILSEEMTLGEMAQFSAYVGMLYSGPVFLISDLPRQMVRVYTSTVKVFDLLDEEPDIQDKPDAKEITIRGAIQFDNVRFGYDDATEVLKGVSIDIQPGEFIGIVGKSGVGKSTLINLVMRMYDADSGAVRIDGIDIRDLSQNCLRSQIGVVLQETFLFSGSVYDNIAYAKPDATREEILAASRLSGAHSFIMKLPDAYQTKIGEKGYTLSGGERQRLSIARALLHNPKILILDEATASLDTETEKQIQDALASLSKDRTTLAIAHRLSTLRNATRLIVLDKGKIAEAGTHEELLAQRGIYYQLVMAQRQMSRMTHDS